MQIKKVNIVPGLFKIFDEILVNAADNKQRDPSMSVLKVEIDENSGLISVENNGKGIPIEMHSEYQVYVPELIFGQLLTSSNYDDSQKKTTGGRNGYGAKLTNIFSEKFIIECYDSERKKHYYQEFANNMSEKSTPQITMSNVNPMKGSGSSTLSFNNKSDSTRISFIPDYAKFGLAHLDNDHLSLFIKRVYDIAGTSGSSLSVYLNGRKLSVKDFPQYISLYTSSVSMYGGANGTSTDSKTSKGGKSKVSASSSSSTSTIDQQQQAEQPFLIYEQINDRWEIGVSISDTGFQHVSFVNSIATSRGGTHLTLLTDQLVETLNEAAAKKLKKSSKQLIKPHVIKEHLFVFVNALIENPSFDSQTKECLTSKKNTFGSVATLSEQFVKKLGKSPIVERIVRSANAKEDRELVKNDGKKTKKIFGIPKLDDANEAGGRDGYKCTLILTEGDSAKALAVSGLSVIGRDYYGVFPLRGKLLNVRDSSSKVIAANAEVTSLKQILGLQQNKVYKDTKSLRYGRIMIMTDQDHDGSHIKGLIINLFATFWPSLLQLDGFLTEFITPILKVKKNKQEISFYTIPEFQNWCQEQESHSSNAMKAWTIKYYKGLGTSTAAEAKEYFSALRRHQITFTYSPECESDLELVFGRSQSDARKVWLQARVQGDYLDQSKSRISLSDFVQKELILFSVASNMRAIPSMIDGFKPGQRKVLYAAFSRKAREIKVAQFAAYVAEHTSYHHGEQALTATIVNMAQTYVGSNNINLLVPSGQFGTRLAGGKDAASPRYIFTSLDPIARALFPTADDDILNYLSEENQRIEPDYFVPILPMVLVNGSNGIGTGWSSYVCNYDAREIANNLLELLRHGKKNAILAELHPKYRGFIGDVIPTSYSSADDAISVASSLSVTSSSFLAHQQQLQQQHQQVPTRYTVTGQIEKLSSTIIRIRELPLFEWTSDYKAFLETLIANGDIFEFKEYHTENSVDFVIYFTDEAQLEAAEQFGLYKKFKLVTSLSTTNMVLYDAQGNLKRYSNANEILLDFFDVRYDYYGRRKTFMLNKLQQDLVRLSNKVRFILAVCADELNIRNVKRAVLVETLVKQDYMPLPKSSKNNTGGSKRGGGRDGNGDVDSDSNDDSDAEMDGDDDTVIEVSTSGGNSSSSQSKSKTNSHNNNKVKVNASDYDYLLGLPLWSLTMEKVDELKREKAHAEAEYHRISATTIEEMWKADLESFLVALDKHMKNNGFAEDDDGGSNVKNGTNSSKIKLNGKGKGTVNGNTHNSLSAGTIIKYECEEEKNPKKRAVRGAATSNNNANVNKLASYMTAMKSENPVGADGNVDNSDNKSKITNNNHSKSNINANSNYDLNDDSNDLDIGIDEDIDHLEDEQPKKKKVNNRATSSTAISSKSTIAKSSTKSKSKAQNKENMKPAAKSTSKPTTKKSTKKSIYDYESDEDDELESDEDEDDAYSDDEAPSKSRRGGVKSSTLTKSQSATIASSRPTRTRKAVNYAMDIDLDAALDEDEDDDGSDFTDDDADIEEVVVVDDDEIEEVTVEEIEVEGEEYDSAEYVDSEDDDSEEEYFDTKSSKTKKSSSKSASASAATKSSRTKTTTAKSSKIVPTTKSSKLKSISKSAKQIIIDEEEEVEAEYLSEQDFDDDDEEEEFGLKPKSKASTTKNATNNTKTTKTNARAALKDLNSSSTKNAFDAIFHAQSQSPDKTSKGKTKSTTASKTTSKSKIKSKNNNDTTGNGNENPHEDEPLTTLSLSERLARRMNAMIL
jgi:DNA topoisomerase-2